MGESSLDEPTDVARAVKTSAPGTTIPVTFVRNEEHRLARIRLEGKPQFEDQLRLAFVGAPAPPISGVVTFQGHFASLKELRGQVVLLEFWASWCGVCRYLAPVLNRLQKAHRPEGLEVVGITVDPPARGQAAATRTGQMDYTLASDPGGKITRKYLASQVPTVFVIDRQGIVVDVVVGVSQDRILELKQLVEELLANPA